MAQSGKVTVWKGTYGFAVQESGQVVYVRADEIGGGRLRVGHTIQFDTVEADGHEGKLKGTNVSGEGVLKKGEMLEEADIEVDKKLRAEIREELKAKNKEEYDPVYDEVTKMSTANKVQLVKELLQELDLGVLQSGKDSGKRADPTDKGSKTYTKKEFVAFYGPQKGEIMWNLAGRTAKGGKGGKGGKGARH